MDQIGKVSLWIGNADSRQALEDALKPEFSEDGDFLGSAWSRAFGIGYYDEGVKESEYRALTRKVDELLKGISYEAVVLPRFVALLGEIPPSNCFVALYDHDYDGTKREWSDNGVSLKFVGTVSYQ